MQLATRRFILRDFTDDDIPAFVAYHMDPRSQTLYGPDQCSREYFAGLVRLFKSWESERPRRNFQFAVLTREKTLVGCGGLRMRDSEDRSAELGIELDPKHWGRFGYALEVAKCLVNFGFGDLSLERIVGRTIDANVRIARLAKAFGATPQELAAPSWMAARGWRQIEWHIARKEWLASLAIGANLTIRPRRCGDVKHA